MLIAVDIGNTNIVIGFIKEGKIEQTMRISSNRDTTSDEIYLMINQFMNIHKLDDQEKLESIICSVSPPLTYPVQLALEKVMGGKHPHLLNNKADYGLTVKIDRREELGDDRIVNACAAYNKYQGDCVIIDFGTATTFDIVSSKGEYLGGIISLGLKNSVEALYQSTSKLPKIEIQPPENTIGKNTVDCLKSGVVLGYSEMIAGLLHRTREELQKDFQVIATGGLARMMHELVKEIDLIDNDLTLWGLNFIYQNFYCN